MLGKLSIEV
jgi:hypothetical protein